jgi:ABC-type enterochelin transport system permease subunit
VLTKREDFTYALVTALLGAIIWAVVAVLVGWIPLLGPLLVLLAYVALINYRYPGGWIRAILIAVIAWLVVLATLYVLAVLGFTSFGAVGVPG